MEHQAQIDLLRSWETARSLTVRDHHREASRSLTLVVSKTHRMWVGHRPGWADDPYDGDVVARRMGRPRMRTEHHLRRKVSL